MRLPAPSLTGRASVVTLNTAAYVSPSPFHQSAAMQKRENAVTFKGAGKTLVGPQIKPGDKARTSSA